MLKSTKPSVFRFIKGFFRQHPLIETARTIVDVRFNIFPQLNKCADIYYNPFNNLQPLIIYTILKIVKILKTILSVADIFYGVVDQFFYLLIVVYLLLYFLQRINDSRVMSAAELLADIHH